MVYKFTTIKEVIAKVYRDLNLSEEGRWQDMVEWAAEAIEHIGAYPQYIRKTVDITIENHRGLLPCDFVKLETAATKNGNWLKPSQSAFDFNYGKSATADLLNNGMWEDAYTIDNCWMKVNFLEGTVTISYMAVRTDEDGFPMVPDDVSYKEALYWYIVSKLYYPDYLRGTMAQYVYRDIENNWQRYCSQARGNAYMPDLNELESIKQMWVRLLPSINNHSLDFFRESNNRERLKHR